MQKKIKFNPDDLFCSLVLEPAGAARLGGSGSSGSDVEASSAAREASSSGGAHPGVVGVVEISYVNNKETLALLPPGTQGYCYVASMVVAPAWRRRGGAQALLRAAELAAEAWDEQQAVLHVYQDNDPAVQAYKAAGYEVLHSLNKLFARPRHVMIKRW
ncbi:GNAT family N-acetyltransferase [Micractinium conductrix]|uniref:GNAT family N-acetyltransferase n=1 Tax=Micractinium conductrix TaxID=554055 RepID=A0A2P6VIW3_9CHLO|nr:GNAT family N-acetyltransferase [Micractinium conductrix]|eukprot:PSC74043.1 GNAT family N-acetyltransferase [Micractinium conductrix]